MAGPAAPRRITLLTDFGTPDGYVAEMRGVIAAQAPEAWVEDAAHDIAPGDVSAAAWALGRYWAVYPEGTVHVVVVDPGVGSDRRALALEADGRFGVGPDNGVLDPMLQAATAVHQISDDSLLRQPVSATFHGRDIFAPVAAWLAGGGALARVGPVVTDPVRLEWIPPQRSGPEIRGTIVHVDRFGNLISNIRLEPDGAPRTVSVAGRSVGLLCRSYSDRASGDLLALIGSGGTVEVSVRDGSAARRLQLGPGAPISVRLESPE